MKKILLLIAATALTVGTMVAGDRYSRNIAELPAQAQTVVKQNFKAKLSVIKIDSGITGVSEYEVVLTDGTEITFDRNGEWRDIEVAKGKKVPDFFVPKTILNYIKENNKNKKVVGIEKKRNKYEIELENGIELEFDRSGRFLRYD